MNEWDPIGVSGLGDAEDEYDAYVFRVYSMLINERTTAELITWYLEEVVTQ
jgi:hypothetical protein